jgi:outer membrane protein TolC
MMKKSILLVMFGLAGMFPLSAQEGKVTELSLIACVQTAIERNIHAQTARIDHEKSGYKIEETRAALLPQIGISGSLQDNLKLPTTLISGDLFGQPGTLQPLRMGVQYNTSAAITVNQVLYNQTALTSLKIAEQADDLSRLGVEKASENLAQEIAKLYFLAQTTAQQKALIENNISRTKRMTDITKTLLDNGMGKQVDYDRINVNLQNLYTQLSNTGALHEQQLNMLKYMLEIPVQSNIALTDTVNMPLLQAEPMPVVDFSAHIDIRMLESQKEIARLNQKAVSHGYIPALSSTGQYAFQGMRTEFANYFNSSPENKWYNSSYIGVSLSFPVFDGWQKRAKYRQAKSDYTKAALTMENTKERFNADFKNALNNYYNHKTNVERQKQNIALAETVYAETTLKYREGLASMSDLLQDEMALSHAQSNYLNALYNFKEAEIKIMSLNGEIGELIKN